MDVTSIVSGFLAGQAGGLQSQIAAFIFNANADAEKSVVQALLVAGQQNLASLANVGAGIGGNLNISA